MRQVAHGTAWFDEENSKRILELMLCQCSAMRSAYQAIHKRKLSGNDVKKYVKQNYMTDLNQRYVADAVNRARQLRKKEGVVFGGKKPWKELQNGSITKEQWQEKRNNQLYSRGDRAHSGNPNIRIEGDKIYVNDPSGRGKWIEGKVFLPGKWNPGWECYLVRILNRDGKFEVKIEWDEEAAEEIETVGGAVGIDINPDGVAVVETDEHGNLVKHHYELEERIPFASEDKRAYDIGCMANRVVEFALCRRKKLVLEKLQFKVGGGVKAKGRWNRKGNRMKSNFPYRKMLDAIKRCAMKRGVPVEEVHPAFTSQLGLLKYQQMYSLNRHTAAALVIARRGMGIRERQDFTVTKDEAGKEKVNLEGRGFSIDLTQKAYSFLVDCFCKMKSADLTGSLLAPGRRYDSGTGKSAGKITAGEPSPITGRTGKDVRAEALAFF